jgi:hypothetical protein
MAEEEPARSPRQFEAFLLVTMRKTPFIRSVQPALQGEQDHD